MNQFEWVDSMLTLLFCAASNHHDHCFHKTVNMVVQTALPLTGHCKPPIKCLWIDMPYTGVYLYRKTMQRQNMKCWKNLLVNNLTLDLFPGQYFSVAARTRYRLLACVLLLSQEIGGQRSAITSLHVSTRLWLLLTRFVKVKLGCEVYFYMRQIQEANPHDWAAIRKCFPFCLGD